jgi:hypothetical protein
MSAADQVRRAIAYILGSYGAKQASPPVTSANAGLKEPWQENETGPDCSCGNPTVVKLLPNSVPVLMCLFHSGEAGLMTRLPAERPADWYEKLPEE